MRRRALLTGASAGLGFAAAAALVEHGVPVTLVARRREGLDKAASKLAAKFPGAEVETVRSDLEDPDAVKRMIEGQLRHASGCPDILVHVAGGPPLYRPTRENEEAFRRFLESHSFSLWFAAREFAPKMQDKGWGRIIAVMSRAVSEPRGDNPLSAAVRLPGWAILKSYARSGEFPAVTFNAVLPGLFDTERFREVCRTLAERDGKTVDGVRARFLAAIPAGRVGRPEELGALCAFLASNLGGYINGQRIVVDGGSTAFL
jgi:3-oxoacyl-[acyl-carrier protein] reductase